MSFNLSYIKTKNSLNIACVKSDLCNAIVTRVQSIDNFQELKFDNELLIFVCNCVENTVSSSGKKKIDKKTLVIDIFKKLFEISDEDEGIISKSINFLCDNSLVEKIPSIQKYSSIITNYIKNKL